MQNAGTAMSRIFGGIKGALGNLSHTTYIGPKALNGGEVVIAAGTYPQNFVSQAGLPTDLLKTAVANTCTACKTQSTTRTWPSWPASLV